MQQLQINGERSTNSAYRRMMLQMFWKNELTITIIIITQEPREQAHIPLATLSPTLLR